MSDSAPIDAWLQPAIVVGIEGSETAAPAMGWAAAEAARRGVSLRTAGLAELPAATSGADLLVVGASRSTEVTQWLFGAISRAGARRRACPVVVVRGRHREPIGRIVVGVDASNASAAALAWALEEADCHDAEVVVVHAWSRLTGAGRSPRLDSLARADAQCIVDVAVRRCGQHTKRVVRGEVIEGEASAVLTAASEDADLLAVGSRGRSGFKTMLYGSVALAVAEHASCPVAVIHPRSWVV